MGAWYLVDRPDGSNILVTYQSVSYDIQGGVTTLTLGDPQVTVRFDGRYNIKVEESEGLQSVGLSVNGETAYRAKKGETIRVLPEPEPGYRITGVKWSVYGDGPEEAAEDGEGDPIQPLHRI